MKPDLLYQIALSLVPNIGPVQAKILLQHCEAEEIFHAKKSFLETYQAFLQASSFNGSHPIFGTMSKELWGDAMYIHLNHHLEQFGV